MRPMLTVLLEGHESGGLVIDLRLNCEICVLRGRCVLLLPSPRRVRLVMDLILSLPTGKVFGLVQYWHSGVVILIGSAFALL